MNNIDVLEYRISRDTDEWYPLLHYTNLAKDEIIARKGCHYYVRESIIYKKLSSAIEADRHVVYLEKEEDEAAFRTASKYEGQVCVEVRDYKEYTESPLLYVYHCHHHLDALDYLFSDFLLLFRKEWQIISTEMDDDRKVYVMYANETDKEM